MACCVIARWHGGRHPDGRGARRRRNELRRLQAPSTLTIKQGTTLGAYDTTGSNKTIAIATPIVATLTHSSTQSIDIDDNPPLYIRGMV